jgi:hypothetical protein
VIPSNKKKFCRMRAVFAAGVIERIEGFCGWAHARKEEGAAVPGIEAAKENEVESHFPHSARELRG